MNRLRGDRVIVDLTKVEDKDPYKETGSGIFIPESPNKEAFLTKGIVVLTGHQVHTKDIKEGDVVYVKKSQGERLDPESNEYLFTERAIIGND